MSIQLSESDLYRHISKIYGISIRVLDPQGSLQECYSPDPEGSEHLFQFSSLRERFLQLLEQVRSPQIISSDLNQVWVGVPFLESGAVIRILVIGPVFTSAMSRTTMLDYARSYNVGMQPRDMLMAALLQTPVYHYFDLYRPFALITSLIFGLELDISSLPITGLAKNENQVDGNIEKVAQPETPPSVETNVDNAFRLRLMECVREGRLYDLKRLLRSVTYSNARNINTVSDPIRKQKDMFILSLATAENAAQDGGLSSDIVFPLTDHYIEQVEALNSLVPILMLHRDMLYDFTKRMSTLKRTNQYSKLVNDCCNYIHDHLNEPVRVSEVTDSTGLNAHFVSQKFKEETGQSINDYVRATKISEAKALLRYSELSLAEISERLAYSSQSFFTATFREVTGLTPRQYRERPEA